MSETVIQEGSGRPFEKEFSEEEVKEIKKFFWIECDWLHNNVPQSGQGTKACPVHNRKHRRLPDAKTWALLIKLYPDRSMQAWGNIYGTTREAIRVLHKKATGGNYGEDKYRTIYGEKPNRQLFEAFCKDIEEKIDVDQKSIQGYHGIEDAYFIYWGRREPEIKQMILDSKKRRQHNKDNRALRKCNRCHTLVPREDFPKSNVNRDGLGLTCNDCNRAQVIANYEKRKREFDPKNMWSEKKCSTCKTIKHREMFDIARGMSGGLQSSCRSCMDKYQHSNPKRRQKFIDAGLDTDKACLSCEEVRPFWDYYLIKANPYGKEGGAYATSYCRGCVKKAREGLPQAVRDEVTFATFSVRWRGEHTVMNNMLVNVNPFSYALTKARVWELQIEIEKAKNKGEEE